MSNKDYVLVGVALLVVLVAGVSYPVGGKTVVERVTERVGAASGPDVYNHTTFFTGSTEGGYVATTTNGTVRLVAADFPNDVSYMKITPGSATTFTLPASSTLTSLVPQVGMCKNLLIENGSATNDVTLAVGTGWDIKNASSTNVVIHGTVAATRVCRLSTTDLGLFVVPSGI